MSRLTQAIAFLNVDSKKLNDNWISQNLTSITLTKELKILRKKTIKNKNKSTD
jgi:hypothetical protein